MLCCIAKRDCCSLADTGCQGQATEACTSSNTIQCPGEERDTCGGIAGKGCKEGLTCVAPATPDAQGVCKTAPSPAEGAVRPLLLTSCTATPPHLALCNASASYADLLSARG